MKSKLRSLNCIQVLSICFLVFVLSCDRQGTNERDEHLKDFRPRLADFLSAASALDNSTVAGLSDKELLSRTADLNGKFDVVEAMWPKSLNASHKADLKAAVQGWTLAARAANCQFPGTTIKCVSNSQQPLFDEILKYGMDNPFTINLPVVRRRAGTRFEEHDVFLMEYKQTWDALIKADENAMPAILSIASAYFKRSKPIALSFLQE